MNHLVLFTLSLVVFSANLYFLGILWFSDNHDRQVRSLMAMGVATCYWTMFDAVAEIAQTYAYAYIYMLRSVMLIVAPFCFLLYILYLSDSKLTANKGLCVVFVVVPAIDILLVLTNSYHRLIFSQDGFPLPEYGPLFIFHAAVAYLAILLGIILLFRYIIQTRPPAPFAWGWVAACIVPVVINVLFTIGVINMSQDIAPFGFSLIFILFALYSYRSRLDNLRRMALSDVFNSYKNAIVLLNNYNIVEEANAAFHAYFPGCEIQPLKTKIGDLYSYFETEAQDAGSRELFEAERRDGTYCAKGDYVLRLPESQTMTFTVNRQEVRNANGRMTGWLLTLSDVSTYHRMIEEINQQNEQLAIHKEAAEAASEAKSIFLATMSHEMRTPLNAIIGLSEMALRRDSDATTKANIVKVHRSGINLLNVINDILDISKIESGRFELLPITYNTADLIHEAVATNRVRIGLKPIEFILKVDENLPTQLVGDELRVKQIFNNLLSNAIKYTHEGTVTLDISCRVTETDVWLRLQVSDTGIGIKPEDIPNLFLEYQQVDMKANRRVEGTGLGLSITEHLAQLMGGEIEVSSIYGTGSTFSATIHQVAASSESIGAATARTLEEFSYLAEQQAKNDNFVFTDIPHSRFLVVDDVEVNVEVARGMLEPYDAEVDCLDSGQAAVDAIRKAEPRYDLIFMDHMMPGMDGIEAVHIIRSEIGTEYAKNIPIVALTASAMVGSREMFLEEGFQDFLAKPIDFKLLDAILVRWKAQRESGVYDLRSKDTVILENS